MFPAAAFPAAAFPAAAFPGSGAPPLPVLIEDEVCRYLDARLPWHVWGDVVKPEAKRPYYRVTLSDGDQVARRLSGRSLVSRVVLQFDAYADTGPAAELAIETLALSLDGFRGPMGRATIKAAVRKGRRGGYDPVGNGSAKGTIRRMNEYTITYY